MENRDQKQRNPILRFLSSRGVGQVVIIAFVLVGLCLFFNTQNSNFLGKRNIANLLRQIAPYIIIGIGQGYVDHRRHRPVHRLGRRHELHDHRHPDVQRTHPHRRFSLEWPAASRWAS